MTPTPPSSGPPQPIQANSQTTHPAPQPHDLNPGPRTNAKSGQPLSGPNSTTYHATGIRGHGTQQCGHTRTHTDRPRYRTPPRDKGTSGPPRFPPQDMRWSPLPLERQLQPPSSHPTPTGSPDPTATRPPDLQESNHHKQPRPISPDGTQDHHEEQQPKRSDLHATYPSLPSTQRLPEPNVWTPSSTTNASPKNSERPM